MDVHAFLSAAVVLLAASAVTVALFKRLGLESVLGLLAAGIVVGPWGLEVTSDVVGLRQFAEIGVVLLLFVIGLEMQPEKLWSMRRLVFGLGTAQVVVTGVVIGIYATTFAGSTEAAVIIGLGLALSSTAFVMQMLSERGELGTDHGRTCFAILLLQDLAIVPLLALVPLLAGGPPEAETAPLWQRTLEVAGLLGIVILAGRYVLPVALQRVATPRNREAFVVVTMLAVLSAAWIMEIAGLSMALGAFVMGMLLSRSTYRHQLEAVVEPFKAFLIGLFFISVGMSIDLDLVRASGVEALAHVLVIITVKAVILFALCMLFGTSRATAVRTALLLPQCGEFGFVLFGAAAAAGVISNTAFVYLILFISISMLITPPLARLAERIAGGLAAPPPPDKAVPRETLNKHVIVAGFGRVGRVVCLLLKKSEIPYVAFDLDPQRIALGRKEGHPIYFGDVGNADVLAAAGVGRAAGVVISVDDERTTERVVSTIRTLYPSVAVHARARDLRMRDELLAQGVTRAIPDAAEASLVLGGAVLEGLGLASDDVEQLLQACRHDGYAIIRPPGVSRLPHAAGDDR